MSNNWYEVHEENLNRTVVFCQVRFFYSFTCRENLYLVMEYLNGGDMYSMLRNLGCLEEKMARVYVAELVSFSFHTCRHCKAWHCKVYDFWVSLFEDSVGIWRFFSYVHKCIFKLDQSYLQP